MIKYLQIKIIFYFYLLLFICYIGYIKYIQSGDDSNNAMLVEEGRPRLKLVNFI